MDSGTSFTVTSGSRICDISVSMPPVEIALPENRI